MQKILKILMLCVMVGGNVSPETCVLELPALTLHNLQSCFLKHVEVINYDALSYNDQLTMDIVITRMRQLFDVAKNSPIESPYIYQALIRSILDVQLEVLFLLELASVSSSLCIASQVEIPLSSSEYAHVAAVTLYDLVTFEYEPGSEMNAFQLVYHNLPERFKDSPWALYHHDEWHLLHEASAWWQSLRRPVEFATDTKALFYVLCRTVLLQSNKTQEDLLKLEDILYRADYEKNQITKGLFELLVCRLSMLKKEAGLRAQFKKSETKINILIKHKALLEDPAYATLLHSTALQDIVGQYRKMVDGVVYENLSSVQLTYEIYGLTKKLMRLQQKHTSWLACCNNEVCLVNDMLIIAQDAAAVLQNSAINSVLSGQLFEKVQGLLDSPMVKKVLDRYVGVSVADLKKVALNIVGFASPIVALGLLKLVAPQVEDDIKKEAEIGMVEGPHIAAYLEKHPEIIEKLLTQQPVLVSRLTDQIAAKLSK